MRVGILSDTHVSSLDEGLVLAQQLLSDPFADVEVILHAGDHVHPDLSCCFYPLLWYGVCGNMDKPQSTLPVQRIVELSGFRIGMMHGWGSPNGIEKRVLNSFYGTDIDVLVFGHSHRPVCQKVGSILLFNPGSPTDRRSAPHHTVGLLNLEDEATGQIIRID